MKAITTEAIAIDDLVPHPRNYKSHPPDQLAHIKASLSEHGMYRNVVISSDGYILAGHGVVLAAKELGWTEIECKVVDVAHDDPQARKILVGDNEISNLASVDDRQLTELLKSITEGVDDELALLGTGYDEQVLANLVMVTRPKSEIEDFDAASEWVGMPEHQGQSERPLEIVVKFESEERKQEFLERLGISPRAYETGFTTMWYPPRENDDLKSLAFVHDEDAPNDESAPDGSEDLAPTESEGD